MRSQMRHTLALSFLSLLVLRASSAEASFLQGMQPQSTHWLRAGIVLLATLAGAGLAFLLSPQAAKLRLYAVLGLVALTMLIAIFGGEAVGWSAMLFAAPLTFTTSFLLLLSWLMRNLFSRPKTFGSAEWADEVDLEANQLFGASGYRLGRFPGAEGERPIHYTGDKHLLTIAPTRAGKGVSAIVPNLKHHRGSALVIDPKGENARLTAKTRHQLGQKIHIVDPWGVTGARRVSRFNPLDWLDESDIDMPENAMLLADALIVPTGDKDQFWVEEAKALIQGLILYVATEHNELGHRHLGRVRDLLLLDEVAQQHLFQQMARSHHHLVASTAQRCLQKDKKLLSNVMASAQAQTHILDSARLRESLSLSDFSFSDLKAGTTTVYLVLPADRLHTFGRWLRLLIQQAITENARNIDEKPATPTLFMLDEMPALGRLTMVEQAYGLMAGFGMQLWGIVQDVSQLKTLYGEGWETFIGNSGVIQYFGSRDQATAEYFSSLCGVTTVWSLSNAISRTFGSSSGQQGGSSSSSMSTTDTATAAQRKLAYPDELMRMAKDQQLLIVDNVNPITADRL